MGSNLDAEAGTMKTWRKSKYVHEGHYVAEIEVTLVADETGWSPYLSVDDARRLDAVREALRHGDLASAAAYGQIYELQPITPQS